MSYRGMTPQKINVRRWFHAYKQFKLMMFLPSSFSPTFLFLLNFTPYLHLIELFASHVYFHLWCTNPFPSMSPSFSHLIEICKFSIEFVVLTLGFFLAIIGGCWGSFFSGLTFDSFC